MGTQKDKGMCGRDRKTHCKHMKLSKNKFNIKK